MAPTPFSRAWLAVMFVTGVALLLVLWNNDTWARPCNAVIIDNKPVGARALVSPDAVWPTRGRVLRMPPPRVSSDGNFPGNFPGNSPGWKKAFADSVNRWASRLVPRRWKEPDASSWALSVPVQWDPDDMGYVALVEMGSGDRAWVVLDSGSSHLAVATVACAEQGLCLPRHATYDPGHSSSVVFSGRTESLRYATLHMEAEAIWETVTIAGFPGCPRGPNATWRPESVVVLPSLACYAVRAMEGTHSNVLGLMSDDRQGSDTTPSFLSQVFARAEHQGERVRRAWGVELDTDGTGWLMLGASALCRPETIRWSPTSAEFRYGGAYVLDIVEVRVASRQDGPFEVQRQSDVPRFLMIDTGTPLSYATSNCLPVISEVARTGKWLEIELLGGTVLRFAPRALQTFVSHDDSLSLDRLVGGSAGVLLLGALLMRGHRWVFDWDHSRVGVSDGEFNRH